MSDDVFIKEICANCKNPECERGIVKVQYKDGTLMKCVNYIAKDKEGYRETEVEKYYRNKGKKKNANRDN